MVRYPSVASLPCTCPVFITRRIPPVTNISPSSKKRGLTQFEGCPVLLTTLCHSSNYNSSAPNFALHPTLT